MILQSILNWVAELVAGIVAAVPPMPQEFNGFMYQFGQTGSQLGRYVENLGVIMPWESFAAVIGMWLTGLTMVVTFMGVRVVLWAFGR